MFHEPEVKAKVPNYEAAQNADFKVIEEFIKRSNLIQSDISQGRLDLNVLGTNLSAILAALILRIRMLEARLNEQ